LGARNTTACPAELPPPISATSSPSHNLASIGEGAAVVAQIHQVLALNAQAAAEKPAPDRDDGRLSGLVLVNGPAMKCLIEEEFGDASCRRNDFDMGIDRRSDPKGDRVRLTMTGKFLPFKDEGAQGN
jgi:cyanate lyase